MRTLVTSLDEENTPVLGTVFAPTRWLMRQMNLSLKFALLAIVLLTPTAFVTKSFLGLESAQIDFSAAEKLGTAYITPSMQLLQAVVDARSAAVFGEAPDVAAIRSGLSAVDEINTELGQELVTKDGNANDMWASVKTTVNKLAADAPTGPESLAQYDEAATAVVGLIGRASDGSNLTLDPDLDSYYVMDMVTVKLPALSEAVGHLDALIGEFKSSTGDSGRTTRIAQIAVVNGVAGATLDGLLGDVDKALKNTNDEQLKPDLEALTQKVTDSVRPILKQATALVESAGTSTTDFDAQAAVAAVHTLHQSASPALDRLLDTRIAGFEAKASSAKRVIAISLLLALYCFGGLVMAVSGSVKPMLRSLASAAEGRLSVPKVPASRDEFGKMGAALTATLTHLEHALRSIARNADELTGAARSAAAVSQQLSGAAEQTSLRAETVATASEEMTAAIADISRSAVDATVIATEARSAAENTDVTMSELHRRSTEIGEVVEVISEIAEQTNLLALNATIEAARAGAAGKGFAVVADEVKQLANETAKATETISAMVEQIQNDTTQAVDAIGSIRNVIQRVSDTQSSISVAVEEQTATTAEIGRAVSDVANTAGETTLGATHVQELAQGLNRMSDELQELVSGFTFEE
ncbi:MAG: methyl-accepting chemotaxis protein [Acidimicrobiia bacterium]